MVHFSEKAPTFGAVLPTNICLMNKIVTLDEFIIRRQKDFPYASGELSGLLRDIGVAAKVINQEVNKAGLVNILGMYGSQNASGEEVAKLDVYANERMKEFLRTSGECAAIASEEEDGFIEIEHITGRRSEYIVVFDPLDGSSNIDVNVSIGTIFAIYRRKSPSDGPILLSDFLQSGTEQVAAGYVIYGSSTMLVYTTGRGVNGFTLDPGIGEFCLSHPDIRIPQNGKYYSLNQGYYKSYSPGIQAYLKHCEDKGLGLRYIGSMVADVHRTLIKGGIFLYPETKKNPDGKLRLVYECNPMAFLVEQAGGLAITTGLTRILEEKPDGLHVRRSIIIGSPAMVEEVAHFIREQSPAKVG